MSILSNSLAVKGVLFGDSTAVYVNICSNYILTDILLFIHTIIKES
ncbi:hypothetical protein SAMN05660349_00374 [Macellibacteroides fermentans]|uniref:Uncharacterized protein n=1 Tax=Parabacteroides chartae TaxID=1037355 RepID=A0A1T5A4C1_9BACT|nr:hypothetical protein SAMN05660349_00374 [Parabacteroides chartae]